MNKNIFTRSISPEYALEISRGEKCSLVFQSACRKLNWDGGMEGYTYCFHDRTYRDVDSLWKEKLETIGENVSIGRDAFGETVLRVYHSIPTFDSGDREWHSEAIEFLIYDGKDIHLVTMAGGYRIAQLTFYEKLLSADERMKPIFEKLGWPVYDTNQI